MKLFRRTAPFLIAVCLVFLTGCWDYQEVESLYLVTGMAIDTGINGYKYHTTFEVLDLSSSENQQDGGGGQKSKMVESEGDTIADSVKNANQFTDKALYFNDCKVIIFSRAIADRGLTPVIDWLNRDPEPRFTIRLLVSGEKTAGEILKPPEKQSGVMAFQIANCVESTDASGRSPMVSLYQINDMLLGEGKDVWLPCVVRMKIENVEQIGINGSAVFIGDRCVGLRTEAQTRGDMYLTHTFQSGLLLVGVDHNQRNISLEIKHSQAETKVVKTGLIPEMQVAVKLDCMFSEECTEKNYLSKLGIRAFEERANDFLAWRGQAVLKEMQESYASDIYGFGRRVYETDPALWQKLKPNWHNTFRKLKVWVSVKVHVNNAGIAYPKED
jgi:spore germination protein KC